MMPLLGSVSEVSSAQFPFAAMAVRPLKTGDETRRKYLEITTGLLTPTPEQRSIIT
jgi:hypothetical protein